MYFIDRSTRIQMPSEVDVSTLGAKFGPTMLSKPLLYSYTWRTTLEDASVIQVGPQKTHSDYLITGFLAILTRSAQIRVGGFRLQVLNPGCNIDHEPITILDNPCAQNFAITMNILALKPECFDAVTMRIYPHVKTIRKSA
ncbi:hypothetical protein B0H13DRAFT_1861079 [Mycena leptocephala]|nr:hypothetical protein B0H13DRAFT_1861079 [Mycena leptocephala]